MKALRFAASVLIIGAILALYRTLLPVNNTAAADAAAFRLKRI
jgi:hypothetical protein